MGKAGVVEQDPKKNPDLEDLKQRLKKAQGSEGKGAADNSSGSSKGDFGGVGFRVASELVASLAVGVGIGYLLDDWLGTKPWLMVLFFFLGAAAGVLNVYRAVSGIGMAPGYRKPDQGTGSARAADDAERNDRD